MSPQTEAFKMIYSDLLNNVKEIASLEDRLSLSGIVSKDLDSSEVKPLKRKINLLEKIGSVITDNPEKFEEILDILESHVPEQVIAEMRFLEERFLAVETGKLLVFAYYQLCDYYYFIYMLLFQCHKHHKAAILWPAAGLPPGDIVCPHDNDYGEVCDVHTARNCVNCPNPASFIVSPCQCGYCEG